MADENIQRRPDDSPSFEGATCSSSADAASPRSITMLCRYILATPSLHLRLLKHGIIAESMQFLARVSSDLALKGVSQPQTSHTRSRQEPTQRDARAASIHHLPYRSLFPSCKNPPLFDVAVKGVVMVEELLSLGVIGSTTWLRTAMIHSCCRSSTADGRSAGSRAKHLDRKSSPGGLIWSALGSCGGLPWAMLYMIAHSLSRFAHGRRPVAISNTTHPSDQMSTAPALPGFSPLMTSGDMYMGVPVIDLLGFEACRSAASVRPCRAITLAAPKSTYLMMPFWLSRISRHQARKLLARRCGERLICEHSLSGLISRWAMPLSWR